MANKKIPGEAYLPLELNGLVRQMTDLWRRLADWINNARVNDLSDVDAASPASGAYLRYNATTGKWEPFTPYQEVAYGTGSVYTMTTTPAAIVMGTTSPAITLTQAGTYLIGGYVRVFSGAATITNQFFTLTLRRTNNTAADLTNGSVVVAPMPATTASYTMGVYPMPWIVYTTTNTNDALTIFASISAALGAGSL